MTAPAIPYQLVNTPEKMMALTKALAGESSLALDMEMENHYHRYGLHIALIQISTVKGRHYIIDPLAEIDLQALGDIFANKRQELILHDSDFDRRAAHHVYKWQLNRIFDTKIAAQLCGHRTFGLGSLLAEYFDITTNKRFQTTDWMKRPLAEKALEYAVGDTAYLHALRDKLADRLAELGRTEWAKEEFAYTENQEIREPESPAHHRIKRSSLLNPRQLAILGALAEFRDQLAQKLNRPHHFVMRNEIMLELAALPELTMQRVRGLRGVHPALQKPRNQKALMDAWQKGYTAPQEEHPARRRRPRAAPNSKIRLKEMQQWRAARAAELDLEPYLILDNDILNWCANHPGEQMPPEITALVRRWQYNICQPQFSEKFDIPLT